MSSDPTHIGDITNVQGDTITAAVRQEAAPGLLFSRGHAYFVGQVGAYVRIPLGLVDLFAVVVQVGSTSDGETASDGTVPGRPWMRLELLGEAHRDGSFERGVARYPSIGDRVHLVTAKDLEKVYGVDDAARHVQIGRVSNAPQMAARVDINRLITRHAAVVGTTGSGKSTSVTSLVHAITSPTSYPSARVLIMDVHGEYAHAFKDRGVSLRVDSSIEPSHHGTGRPRSASLQLPYWALPFEDLLDLTLGKVDENAATFVQAYVADAKREHAKSHPELGLPPETVTADSPLPFSIRELWMHLHEMQFATHTASPTAQSETTRAYAQDANGNELRGDIETVTPPVYQPATPGGASRVFLSASTLNIRRQTEALGARLRDPRFDFLFRPGPWDVPVNGSPTKSLGDFLETWLGAEEPVAIADLSGVPNQVLRRVVSILLRLLYEAIVWARDLPEGGRQRPLLVVLEEAHRYLSDANDEAGEIVERIVKEGRKFGVGVLIVSQRPSEIRPTVLSQLGSFFVLRLSNSSDRALVRSALPDNLAGLFDAVPVLRTGEALVVGEIVRMPTRVLLDAPKDSRPDSQDPDVVGAATAGGWATARGAQDYERVAKAWMRQGASTEAPLAQKNP